MANLQDVKDEAEYELDMQAEFARRRITTRGEVMSAVYQEKVQEAIAFVAAGYPTAPNVLKNYPFIKEESDALGKTPKKVADDIIAARTAWIQKMAKLEGARLAGKADIRTAVSENNVETVKGRVKDTFKTQIP